MNILIIGSGGREHTLTWKIAQSSKCDEIFIAPGNAGTSAIGTNLHLDLTDFQSISDAIIEHNVSLLVIGPEDPLADDGAVLGAGVLDPADQFHPNLVLILMNL